MLDWLTARNAAARDPANDAPDPSNDWDFDPAQPAEYAPESVDTQLSRVLEKLTRLVDVLTPGIPGVEGAERWPVLAHDAITVNATATMVIPGNRNRTSILIHNLGDAVVYVVADGATDVARGMPIPVNAEREIRTPNPIRMRTESGTASVRVLEESS